MGLPFLLLAATTALVEERVRGSLDVLLATPISSRKIVLTKWWSVYRKVPWLIPLPAFVAAMLAWGGDRWFVVGLIVLYVLSSAALWTSIGIALSTWVPRLGRAVSIGAAAFTLVVVGWPILARTLYVENNLPLRGRALGNRAFSRDLRPDLQHRGFVLSGCGFRLCPGLDCRPGRPRPRTAAGHDRNIRPLSGPDTWVTDGRGTRFLRLWNCSRLQHTIVGRIAGGREVQRLDRMEGLCLLLSERSGAHGGRHHAPAICRS